MNMPIAIMPGSPSTIQLYSVYIYSGHQTLGHNKLTCQIRSHCISQLPSYISEESDTYYDALTKAKNTTDPDDIKSILLPHQSRWRDIGIDYGINEKKLDQIKEQYEDPGDCLLEMIKEWLESKKSPLPTRKESTTLKAANLSREEVSVEKGTLIDPFFPTW